MNNTFFTLIPKKQNRWELKDYGPISLLSHVNEIIAKILTLKLKRVMHGIILQPQGAFIEGRQILDGVLTANKCIGDRRIFGRNGVICKLDLEKTYDRVKWNFLDYILERLGLGAKWRILIFYCVCSGSFSFLMNGSSKGFFKSSKSLRQGDPLSPFIFVIVCEVLSKIISKAELGFFRGFEVGDGGVLISHLQLTDDTMIFCDVNVEQLGYLRCILVCFEAIHGLNINFSKSEMFPIGENCDI